MWTQDSGSLEPMRAPQFGAGSCVQCVATEKLKQLTSQRAEIDWEVKLTTTETWKGSV